jgi:dCTP deaminase
LILIDREIKDYIERGEIVISPYDPALVNPSSLDFRLGNIYTYTKPISYNYYESNTKVMDALLGGKTGATMYGYIDPRDTNTFKTITETHEEFYIFPGQTICVSQMEYTKFPDDISAKIVGKSSLARLGLDQSSPGGWAEAGWAGVLTLELTNHADYAIKLTHGMKIGQLIFFKHDKVESSYSVKGHYFEQEAGQGSRGLL